MHLNGCIPAELFGQEVHAFLTMVNSAKELVLITNLMHNSFIL
jgi:PHD/YefM family antitoxin component YafN of YafNO toxin-antitoxin module